MYLSCIADTTEEVNLPNDSPPRPPAVPSASFPPRLLRRISFAGIGYQYQPGALFAAIHANVQEEPHDPPNQDTVRNANDTENCCSGDNRAADDKSH